MRASVTSSPISLPAWLCLAAGLGFALYEYAKIKAIRNAKNVFALAVTLTFKSEQARDAYIELWKPLAAHVARHEHETYAFELSIADTDTLKCLVFERYSSRQYFMQVHRTSDAYLQYKEAQGKLEQPPDVSGQSYIETNLGYFA